MKVLVVEDSERLRKALGQGLTRRGFVVDLAGDGRAGLEYAGSRQYDVVVLDIMMPRKDGLAFLREIRDQRNPARVLILSAKDEIEDRVRGLEAGADDYLVKPFAFKELVARVRTLGRRGYTTDGPVMRSGAVAIDTSRRSVTVGGREVGLTATEYNLVEHLFMRRQRVVSKSQLRDVLSRTDSDAVSNTVEVLVSNVRKKLRKAGVENLIETRRGFGYQID